MQLSSASIDQVAGVDADGLIVVDRDVGGVVEAIRRLDPHLGVRFSPKQKTFSVYWSDGTDTYLVKSINAYQNQSGTWEGLDHRLVSYLESIDSQNRSGYDYVKALQQQEAAVKRAREESKRQMLDELAERSAHAVRKDLGLRKNF